MSAESFKRKLTAILSADVKGYSRLMGENEAETVKTLTAYRKIMRELIQQHRGRVIDSPGDNILAEFASVVDAVQCSVEAQNEFKARNAELPENRRMEFRIGVNLGDVIEEEDRIYGDGVNIAARLEGLADGGGICISGTAFDQVKNKVRVGYQYLGKQTVKNIPDPVRVYKVLMEPEAVGKVIEEVEPKQARWGWKAVAGMAVLVLVAGGFVWNFYFRPPPIEPASAEKMAFPLPDKPSIAVLPFVNMSGDPQQEYFSDGLTEEIITTLSKVSDLFVVDRQSTFSYKGKPVKIQQVAEDLGVRYVLEGSVRKAEDRVRITAQLIDALKGHHLWAEGYDRKLKEILAVQGEITKEIITALEVQLTKGEQARVFARGTDNVEAWALGAKAWQFFAKNTKENNAKARQLMERGIELDPNYALLWTHLGGTHFLDARFGWSESPEESFKRAVECTKKALTLDEESPVAHSMIANIYLFQRQYEKGIAEGERAVSIDPNYADGYARLAQVMLYSGRYEEALTLIKKAIRLCPIPRTWFPAVLGQAYNNLERYEEAIPVFKQLLERCRKGECPPDWAQRGLIVSYIGVGREEEARAEAEELLRADPTYSLEKYSKSNFYKDPARLERFLSALRIAGIPEKPPLPLPDKPSIAVLPFVNMSDDKSQEYFSDGLTEEIITALSKTPKLFVIARNSSFVYKGKPVNVQQVSRELGVKYVLEGSVRRSGDQLRITAQLIDATTGNHLWAERYDKDLKDVFAIQDEVTLEIIKAMQVELTTGETARVTGKGTKNLDAYLKALHAQEQWYRMDKEGSIKARQFAMEAIALDPEYGYPYAIVAWCHMLDVVRQYVQSSKDSMRLAVDAIQKALALDMSDQRIHRALSNLYVMQGKHDEAIAASRRALELCPGGAGPYESLGIALLFACRPGEAIPILEKAMKLDPFPPAVFHRNLSMAYQHMGRYEDAISEGKKAFQINPNDLSTPIGLVFAYAKLGRNEEARAAAEEVLRINPHFTLDSMAETRAKMFAAKCHSDRVYEDVEFIRKADVGLK
jgi:adenylate cyclase